MSRRTVSDVEEYRAFLQKHWQIAPVADVQALAPRFRRTDAVAFGDMVERLCKGELCVEPQLYEWMGRPSRFGPAHSIRWCEILTSGLFATWALRELVREGRVLEVGCSGGFWSEWAAMAGFDVTGLDVEPGLVAFGRQGVAARGSGAVLRSGEFCELDEGGAFDCIVSLQGITAIRAAADESVVFRAVARCLRETGYVVMVDPIPVDVDAADAAIRDAGLAVVAAGMTGGHRFGNEWDAIPGVILKKDRNGRHGLEAAIDVVVEMWEGPFKKYADADAQGWTEQNSAYFVAKTGRPPFEII